MRSVRIGDRAPAVGIAPTVPGVVAAPLAPLNTLTGGAGVAIGLIDRAVVLFGADLDVLAWGVALGVGALIGILFVIASLRAIRAAAAVATPAAGVPIASPAATFTVALFPVAIMVAMMLLVGLAARPAWTIVVAAIFLGLGGAYLIVAWRARRMELAEGLIVIAPSNRLGLRRAPYALRLPR